MFTNITFYRILGLPLLAWGGIITLILLILTAIVGYLTVKNIKPLPLKFHTKLAMITIILAILHGLLAILAFMKF
jgi:uncharacterized membrane protein